MIQHPLQALSLVWQQDCRKCTGLLGHGHLLEDVFTGANSIDDILDISGVESGRSSKNFVQAFLGLTVTNWDHWEIAVSVRTLIVVDCVSLLGHSGGSFFSCLSLLLQLLKSFLGIVVLLERQPQFLQPTGEGRAGDRVTGAEHFEPDGTLIVRFVSSQGTFDEQLARIDQRSQFGRHLPGKMSDLITEDVVHANRIAVVWVTWLAADPDVFSHSCLAIVKSAADDFGVVNPVERIVFVDIVVKILGQIDFTGDVSFLLLGGEPGCSILLAVRLRAGERRSAVVISAPTVACLA